MIHDMPDPAGTPTVLPKTEQPSSPTDPAAEADLVQTYVKAQPQLEVLKSVLPSSRPANEDPARREIVFIMGTNAEILFGSAALFPALGYNPHELRGVSLFTLMNPEDAADLGGMLEAIEPHSQSPTRVRVELRHREGSTCVLVGTTTAVSEEGFGRSYIMRVRVAAFQDGTGPDPESGRGAYFKRISFEDE